MCVFYKNKCKSGAKHEGAAVAFEDADKDLDLIGLCVGFFAEAQAQSHLFDFAGDLSLQSSSIHARLSLQGYETSLLDWSDILPTS